MSKLAELTEAYLAGAKQLRDAVAGMTREQLLARPIPGKWSTLEVVVHLADFEPVFSDRMKRIIALPKPLLLAADENEFARRLAYEHRDVDEELALVEATRREMARILRHLPDEVLTRTGVHSERGVMTLEDVLTYAAKHVTHHLAFVSEKKKALGLGG